VRVVGTNALRVARNRHEFTIPARRILGTRVDVVYGREEARLVYLGVAHTLGDDDGRRLVVDIGGASTECILGQRFVSSRVDSLSMGCVTWSQRFFPDGLMRRGRFEKAALAARVELEPIAERYGPANWDHAIGSSGTIRAVGSILGGNGWTDGEVTRAGLDRLQELLEEARQTSELDLEGLRPDRREVIAGGVAVLRGVFDAFSVDVMRPSGGALREGVLHDLVGRIHHEDVREVSAASFGERLGQDPAHGARCRTLAEGLFDQVSAALGLTPADRLLLGWAAQLHDVGLAVAHSAYHRHGAYLVEHADLAGFSTRDRQEIAALIRGQRRRPRLGSLDDLPRDRARTVLRLLPLLRMALRMRRDRSDRPIPTPTLVAEEGRFTLLFSPGWLEGNPLTRADLDRERRHLASLDLTLELTEST